MAANFIASIWKLLEVILLIHLTSSAVLSFEKFEKRKCSLFVPLDEKLIRYSQYNSATANQDIYFRQSYDLVIASNVNLCLRGFNSSSGFKDAKHISVKLDSIEQDFPIVEEYEFNVPNIYTSCYCSCQTLGDSLNAQKCDYGELADIDINKNDLKLSFNKSLNHGICKDKYGDIGQQISCCSTKFTPSPRGTFIARKLGNPYFVATFRINSGLLTTRVRAFIDPNNPATNIHTRIRMQSWIPKIKSKSSPNKEEYLSAKNDLLNKSANYTEESHKGYTLEDRFIDLYLSIGSKTGLQVLGFHNSHINSGAWIVSRTKSSELYHVDDRHINSLNEWDPGKHGWFRTISKSSVRNQFSTDKKILRTPVEKLQKYLSLRVQNCKQQSFQAYFHGTTATSPLLLKTLNPSQGKDGKTILSRENQYNYRIRKATNIFSRTQPLNAISDPKVSINLAIVTKGAQFKLYPSVNDSWFEQDYIDSSFNASVEMDEDGNTWLKLNLGRSCGKLISGDIRHETDRSIMSRESFSFRLDVPCQKIKGTNHLSNHTPPTIRLSNRYDNQTMVTICLKSQTTISINKVSTCRKNIQIQHRQIFHEVQKPPSIPRVNVMNIPQPIEDVSFWENILSTLNIKEWFGFGETLSWSSNLIVAIKLCFVMIVFMFICKFLSCFNCCKKK